MPATLDKNAYPILPSTRPGALIPCQRHAPQIGAGGGVRTHGGLVHQVLSLTPLAAREPPPAPIPYNPNRIKTLPASNPKNRTNRKQGVRGPPQPQKPCQPSTSTSLAAGESTGGPSETCDAIASPTSDVVELPPISAVLILPSEST